MPAATKVRNRDARAVAALGREHVAVVALGCERGAVALLLRTARPRRLRTAPRTTTAATSLGPGRHGPQRNFRSLRPTGARKKLAGPGREARPDRGLRAQGDGVAGRRRDFARCRLPAPSWGRKRFYLRPGLKSGISTRPGSNPAFLRQPPSQILLARATRRRRPRGHHAARRSRFLLRRGSSSVPISSPPPPSRTHYSRPPSQIRLDLTTQQRTATPPAGHRAAARPLRRAISEASHRNLVSQSKKVTRLSGRSWLDHWTSAKGSSGAWRSCTI